MKINKIIYDFLMILLAVICVFGIIFAVYVKLDNKKHESREPLSVSQSTQKVEKTSTESSKKPEKNETTVSSSEPEPEPEPEPDYPPDPTGPAPDCHPDGDASTGGESVFEVPFGDGYEFPDLSGYEFVFIGDSIYDMNYSNTSMPRQLEVYTNASVYNLSKFSSCASDGINGYISLTEIVETFLSGGQTGYEENRSIDIDNARFVADDHSGKKMVIVINQCINDYIMAAKIANPNDAYDVTTYEGALRTAVSRLKKAYPKAAIIYMKPYYIGINNHGDEINSRELVMDDYIASIDKIVGEFGIMSFDLRSSAFFASYREGYLLEDLLHPNKMCSKTMARLMCEFVLSSVR